MSVTLQSLWRACGRAAREPVVQNGIVRVGISHELEGTVIAFPGTGEGASKAGAVFSWIINAVHLSVGGRHAGWMSQLLSVYLPLRRALKKDTPVIVTGYSQGAALALLLADHLTRQGFYVAVHAFAAPRPFRLWYRSRAQGFWYRNGKDLVTFLPPLTLFYKHGAKRVDIGPKRAFLSIKDHLPKAYESAIMALEK